MTNVVTPFPSATTAGARLIAGAWAAYYAALLHGDPAASGFAEWLAGFWEPSLVRPAWFPDSTADTCCHVWRSWSNRGRGSSRLRPSLEIMFVERGTSSCATMSPGQLSRACFFPQSSVLVTPARKVDHIP